MLNLLIMSSINYDTKNARFITTKVYACVCVFVRVRVCVHAWMGARVSAWVVLKGRIVLRFPIGLQTL